MENRITNLLENNRYSEIHDLMKEGLKEEDLQVSKELEELNSSQINKIMKWLTKQTGPIKQNAICAIGESRNRNAVTYLLPFLEDKNKWVRFQTCGALSDIGDELAFEPLLKRCIEDKSQDVRGIAAFGIRDIDEIKAINVLVGKLLDNNQKISERKHAAEGLITAMAFNRFYGSVEAVNRLIEICEKGNQTSISIIKKVLPKNVDTRSEKLVDSLENRKKFIMIKNSLFRSYQKGDIEDLKHGLEHPNSSIRDFAITLLEKVGGTKAVMSIITALNDDDEIVRQSAIFSLGRIDDVEATNALIEVALNDDDKETRGNAIYALGEKGDTKATDALIEAMKNDNSKDNRKLAIDSIKKIHKEKSVKFLKIALTDEDFNVRFDAIRALGDIKTPEAIESMVNFLPQIKDDEDNTIELRIKGKDYEVPLDVRCIGSELYELATKGAIKGKVNIDKDALNWLSERLTQYEEIPIILGAIGGKGAKILIDNIKSENAKIRNAAASGIQYISDETLLDDLISILLNEKPPNRSSKGLEISSVANTAAISLMRINNRKAKKALQEAQKKGIISKRIFTYFEEIKSWHN